MNSEQDIIKTLRNIVESCADELKRKEGLEILEQFSVIEKNLGVKLVALEEALNFLRVRMAYMKFDLEATRREKEVLKRLLEEKGFF